MSKYKYYISYMKNNLGPYMVVFDDIQKAEEWVRNHNYEITKIDIL